MMSNARSALVVVVAAAVVTLASAAFASAQTPVEAVAEPSGQPCDPCEIHLVGESRFTGGAMQVPLSACDDELIARVYADGSGELEWSPTGVGCALTNCQTTGESHWPMTAMEEGESGVIQTSIRTCVRYGFVEIHCTMPFLVDSPESHQYTFRDGVYCVDEGEFDFQVEWAAEELESSGIELIHLDP